MNNNAKIREEYEIMKYTRRKGAIKTKYPYKMKFSMILAIMTHCHVLFALPFKNIKFLCEETIHETSDSIVSLNEEGPLNPLWAYLSNACYNLNKTLMDRPLLDLKNSEEIILAKLVVGTSISRPLLYSTEPDNIKFKENFFLVENTNRYGTSSNDGFKVFLEYHKNTHIYYRTLLASLFLIAQGADLSLKLDEKTLILQLPTLEYNTLHTKTYAFYVNLNTHTPQDHMHINKPICYNHVKYILNKFFLHTVEQETENSTDVGADYTEHKVRYGDFHKSTIWYMQQYIYQTMDSLSEMKPFIQEVHKILSEQIKITQSSKLKNIYDNLFCVCEKNTFIKTIYTEYVHTLYMGLNLAKHQMLPIYFDESFPDPGYIPLYDKVQGKHANNSNAFFINITETTIMNIFLCLLYNLVEKRYTTEHMPNASYEFKKFFSIYFLYSNILCECSSLESENSSIYSDYSSGGEFTPVTMEIGADDVIESYACDEAMPNSPERNAPEGNSNYEHVNSENSHTTTKISNEVHKDWNMVVAGLNIPGSAYERGKKNQIKSDILSIILVIMDVTGQPESVKNQFSTIFYGIERISKHKGDCAEYYLRLESLLVHIFSSILANFSLNSNKYSLENYMHMDVKLSDISVVLKDGCIFKMTGNIGIYYRFGDLNVAIQISVMNNMSRVSIKETPRLFSYQILRFSMLFLEDKYLKDLQHKDECKIIQVYTKLEIMNLHRFLHSQNIFYTKRAE
ncbi:hypothetical protein NEAUS03_2075 [Nematocida ausubeli]|nr:hypothetical protein NEAUS03_2075 [Nematocida ausubeli]